MVYIYRYIPIYKFKYVYVYGLDNNYNIRSNRKREKRDPLVSVGITNRD
jgi:hypothetical protein